MGNSVCDIPYELPNECLITSRLGETDGWDTQFVTFPMSSQINVLIISRLGETDGWRIWIARTKMSEEQLVFIQTSNNSQQVKLSIKQRKIVLNTGREYKL